MLRVLIEIMRPANCLMAGAAALIGLLIISPLPSNSTALAVIGAVAFVTGAGNTINDYFDREIDAVNRPGRPIPSGRITPQAALFWSLCLFAAGCILAGSINLLCMTLAIANSMLLFLYARFFKLMPLIGNLCVGYLTGSALLFGGLASGQPPGPTTTLALLAALATFSREIEKDIEDMSGDSKAGGRTLPIVAGRRASEVLALLFIAGAISLSYIPALGRGYMAAVTLANVLFLLAAVKIANGDASKAQHMLKYGMAAALAAFLIAAMTVQLAG